MPNRYLKRVLAGLLAVNGGFFTSAAAQNAASSSPMAASSQDKPQISTRQRTILARETTDRAIRREEENLARLRLMENPKRKNQY